MFGFLGRAYHTYKMETGLTMLNWVEVTIFNSFLLMVVSVTGYYMYIMGNAVSGYLTG